MDRADHYRAADDLVWKVRRQLNGPDWRDEDIPSMALQVAAAQVHATLAAVSPDVDRQVREQARAAAAAVARAEELRGVGPAVVELPAYGTEPRDCDRAKPTAPIEIDIEPRQGPPERPVDPCDCWRPGVEPSRPHQRGAPGCTHPTTCRCTATPHDLGSPGCAYPGKGTPR